MRQKIRWIVMIVGSLALASALPGESAVLGYTATRLGTLGGTGSYGNAINAAGQVTGFSYTPGNATWHAVLYADGAMRDLGTLGGPYSSGTGINASGQVAGFAWLPNARHAFLYANGILKDLGTLGGTDSLGTGINASGQVTGESAIAGNVSGHAFIYSNGVMTDLGTNGGQSSSGSAINASGQVTGIYTLKDSPTLGTRQHAFLYSSGTMQDIGTLGGGFSLGTAINDSGQITGWSSGSAPVGEGPTHAFLYSGGVMLDLGTLGGDASYGFGINASGQVVGGANNAGGVQRAFLYSDGTMYDLNAIVTGLGGTLLNNARAINDNGQIVANGCSASLICQAFLLDPLPAHPDPPPKLLAIEYRHPVFDHYFFSANTAEIAALDGGMFPGWVRTGETFNVYSAPFFGTATVCRFFSASFAPKSSHFYSQDAGECSIVNQSGGWQFEGDVMGMPVADTLGNCVDAGTQPVYRLYNNGQGGAPAHRFTTSLATRAQMLAQGWISEGYGPNGVIMCAPL